MPADQASSTNTTTTVHVLSSFSLDPCAMGPSTKGFGLIFASRLVLSHKWHAVAPKQTCDFQTMTIDRRIDPTLEWRVTLAYADGDVVLKEKRLVFRSVGN